MKLPLEEVFLSNTEKSYQYHVWQKEGKIRKISSKLFTTNMLDTIDNIVRRNLWEIVSLLYPQAIISDRTALELKPATDGSIFVISDKRRPTTIGYITIKPRQGQKPTDGDKTFMGKLHLPSTERALLENARITRTPKGEISRCFSKSELEEYLDQTLSRYGEKSLNKIRDSMRKISQELGMDEEFIKINNIIGSLLQTHESPLQSKVAIARSTGHGYDMKRIELFHKLAREIEKYVPTIRYNKLSHLDNLYFYEAYFSNYIEGTKFEVEEAKDIVFNNKIPQNRPNDAHDILGTFKVVSSNELMKAREAVIKTV